MSHQFYPGQKVVALKGGVYVKEGGVYTVADVGFCCELGLRLDGIGLRGEYAGCRCYNCGHRWIGEKWFQAFKFRPFDELDAVIEEIEAMEAPVELETVET